MGSDILIAIIIGLVVAGIVALVYKGELYSVATKHEARNYIRQNSFKLSVEKDLYICSNIKKTAKPKPQEQQKQ